MKHQKKKKSNPANPGVWDLSKQIERYAPAKIAGSGAGGGEEAKLLFALVKRRILAVVAHHRCVVEAARQHPGITKQISICVEKLRSRDRAGYCQWRSVPNCAFEGLPPQDFFKSKNLHELDRVLAMRSEPPPAL